MITFFLFSALLVALTLGVLGWSVLRAPPAAEHASPAQRDANVAIAREQLAALDRARDAGDLDAAAYADERERLERTLAASLDAAPVTRGHRAAAIGAAAVIAIAVPIATGVLYLELGQPEALVLGPQSRGAGTQQADSAGAVGGQAAPNGAPPAGQGGAEAGAGDAQAPALDQLLPELEAKLADRPDDLEGWSLLGRTYLNVQRFDKAAEALERASGLAPNDVDLLTALAEARAMRDGGTLTGAALAPLERAVELDPMHEQGLWLLGIARQQANEHDAAIGLLTRLRGIAVGSGNAAAVATIDEYLSASRGALGLAPIASGSEAAPLAAAPSGPDADQADADQAVADQAVADQAVTDQAVTATGNAITVDVSLSDDARAEVDPAQSVFVFARAAEGPPMPLAVARLTVADLPTTVRLDESMAMLPTMTLATFPTVTVGARVSASGEPAAASGDWFDEQEDVAPADGPQLDLVIDRQVP